MNIELTTYHGSGESVVVNWNNVTFIKEMKCDYSKGVYDSCEDIKDVYTEVNLTNSKVVYVKETLQEIKKKL